MNLSNFIIRTPTPKPDRIAVLHQVFPNLIEYLAAEDSIEKLLKIKNEFLLKIPTASEHSQLITALLKNISSHELIKFYGYMTHRELPQKYTYVASTSIAETAQQCVTRIRQINQMCDYIEAIKFPFNNAPLPVVYQDERITLMRHFLEVLFDGKNLNRFPSKTPSYNSYMTFLSPDKEPADLQSSLIPKSSVSEHVERQISWLGVSGASSEIVERVRSTSADHAIHAANILMCVLPMPILEVIGAAITERIQSYIDQNELARFERMSSCLGSFDNMPLINMELRGLIIDEYNVELMENLKYASDSDAAYEKISKELYSALAISIINTLKTHEFTRSE